MSTVVRGWVARWRAWTDGEAVRSGLTRMDGARHLLRRRRRIGAVAAAGAVASLLVGLRQMGILRRLPEPPGRLWDTDRVTTSPAAFVLGVPDGPVGALGFSAIMILASRLAADPPGKRRFSAGLLAAAALGTGVGAALYLHDMVAREKRLCPYCLTTAAASFALLPLVWPELRGLRGLRSSPP